MLLYRIRFILIFLFLAIGAYIHWRVGIGAAWMSYAAASILLFTHYLFGNVWIAFRLIQRGQLAEANQLLDQIRYPRFLVKRNRAYYHFGRGLLALHTAEHTEGKVHLEHAMELGLFRANDRALALLNLAHIQFVQGDYLQAAAWRQKALDEAPTDLLLKENLEKLGRALAERNN